ncbi:MAG: dTMP kinase [Gemmatimonadota bacterium]
MIERGLFLVLEGVEGAGKSTQARLLVDWMEEVGIPHRLAREPGGTAVGEAIREVLLDPRGADMPAETELLLMLSARAAFVRTIVRPTLADGRVMLADRFELSTFAYQGVGRELGVEQVRELNEFATGGLHPDLTVVLSLPANTGRARQLSSGKYSDRIEAAGAGFHDRVGAAYAELAAEEERMAVVDATDRPEEVHRRIRELLESRFPEPFATARG